MIQVNVKALRGGLKAIKAVVESRSTVPILSHVRVRSTPGQMHLTGTDLELMIEKTIDLEDAGKNRAMAFCADAGTLEKIAGKLPVDGVATIKPDGNTGIVITCGRARFKLPTLPVEEYPTLEMSDWDAQWEQDAGQLTAMIESVGFAMSTEEVRYYLKGIFVHVPDGSGKMFAAATDGHRLARFHAEAAEGATEMPDIIMPKKAISALSHLLDEVTTTVDVSVSTTRFRFEVGTTTLTGKPIDGQFPDYSRVIPSANDKAAWFEPGPLASAVERMLTISSEKTRAIAVQFDAKAITLEVVSVENGTATEEVECEYEGEPLRVGFNGRYLLDILGHLKGTGAEGTRACVRLADAAAGTKWQQSDDADRVYVLMPMRV